MALGGYRVECVDGAAKGFTYITFVPPPEVIVIAKPDLRRWVRVLPSDVPWPQETRYRRGALPALGTDDARVTYNVIEEAT